MLVSLIPQDVKLGKKEFVEDERDFKLSMLTAVPLPPLSTRNFGYGTIFKDWGMLGNDYYGDCVLAGADHETMLYNRLALHPVEFTRDNTLADYGAVTGFDPATGANDNGTYVRDAMNYRRTTGMIDKDGNRHKIDAYVSINAKDFDLMLRCVWTFGAVGIGFEVPGSCMEQFYRGERWEDVGDGNIIGGHYVPIVGTTAPSKYATCITWGRRQFMTKEFYQKYNDEAWVPLSRELMKATGFNMRHIDWLTLSDMLGGL